MRNYIIKRVAIFVGVFLAAFVFYYFTALDALLFHSLSVALAVAVVVDITGCYFGCRLSLIFGLVSAVLPQMWNAATRGEILAFYLGLGAMVAFVLNLILRFVFVRAFWGMKAESSNVSTAHDYHTVLQGRFDRGIMAWVVIIIGLAYTALSISTHEYDYGKAAKEFAKGVVASANGRWLILSNIADNEIKAEIRARKANIETVELVRSDDYRRQLLSRVRKAFPGEGRLVSAAQVSPRAFVNAARKAHPELFQLVMMGNGDVTSWSNRWEAVKGYCTVKGDPFIAKMRRAFAYEGNDIGNRFQERGELDRAWAIYRQVSSEIEPENVSAIINMSGMLRRGYNAGNISKERIQLMVESYFKDRYQAEVLSDLARDNGPVKADVEFIERIRKEREEIIAKLKESGQPIRLTSEAQELIDWNNAMIEAVNKQDAISAARIARSILDDVRWTDFVPANAVLGSVLAHEGDYESAEAFLRKAVAGTNGVPAAVYNDLADVLLHLKKLDEAEFYARRAISQSPESFTLARETLKEILKAK